MALTNSDRRFFAVKVWCEWSPPADGIPRAELCLLLVLAENAEEARVIAWSDLVEGQEHFVASGWKSYYDEDPVEVRSLGVDQVFDTGHSALDDFDSDPLVFTHLFPVHGDKQIDFFNRARLVQPLVVRRGDTPYFGLPRGGNYLEGDSPRWFGVKVWRTWTVAGEDRFFEEVVLVLLATSEEEASQRATEVAKRSDSDVVDAHGDEFHVRVVNIDHVFDGHHVDLVNQVNREVFGQLYTMNPDDTVEFYDSDNDLPFREFSLGD